MKNVNTIQKNRDGFQSKWGFILACVGSAVGMGNIWRLPIMVSKYGGLTFLIPFFIFICVDWSFRRYWRICAGPFRWRWPCRRIWQVYRTAYWKQKAR